MGGADKLRAYFAAADGTSSWDSMKPLFDEAFHPDLEMVTPDGTHSKDGWEQVAKGLSEQGAKVSDLELSEQGDTIYYQTTITMKDGTTMKPSAKGTLKDGQLIRVEPVDPDVYSTLTKLAGE